MHALLKLVRLIKCAVLHVLCMCRPWPYEHVVPGPPQPPAGADVYLQRQKDKEARRTARCSTGVGGALAWEGVGGALAWEQESQQDGGAWTEVVLQAGAWGEVLQQGGGARGEVLQRGGACVETGVAAWQCGPLLLQFNKAMGNA